ncbi:MAG TPA: beta-ketoacyl-[acyl-carrier-protein] synthase family protein, partial [Thermoleophilaceae bacterium]
MSHRRIVVTGVGAVTPLGAGADTLYERWREGASGIQDGLGRCDGFDPSEYLKRKEIKRYDRFTQFAIVAADEALKRAGWEDELPAPTDRIGCVIGTGNGGSGTLEEGLDALIKGPEYVSGLLIPKSMANAASGILALRYGLEGPAFAVVSACSSGADAITDGIRMLRLGETDAMVVGGAEAEIVRLPLAAFKNMEALSEDGVSRPFDARRDGFVMGEGAGILVLEAAEVAERRGAPIFGEILGYGITNDAHHIVAPHPEGRGAILAIERALADAGLSPDDVDYVNAHGTGTPANDRSETRALKVVLGDRAREVPVSSLKSSIGHLIGAAGAVEAVATLLALREGVAPPTLNYEQREDGLDLDYVPNESRPMFANGRERHRNGNGGRAVALSNSFGFGGHNSVL